MYKEYTYGSYKKEIKALLRKRLSAKQRLRYHAKQQEVYEDKIRVLESEIESYFKRAQGKTYGQEKQTLEKIRSVYGSYTKKGNGSRTLLTKEDTFGSKTGENMETDKNIEDIRGIIFELENKHGKNIPTDDIMKEAANLGIEKEGVEEAIEELVRRGDMFIPKHGLIRRL